jgi:hypothetical protein
VRVLDVVIILVVSVAEEIQKNAWARPPYPSPLHSHSPQLDGVKRRDKYVVGILTLLHYLTTGCIVACNMG